MSARVYFASGPLGNALVIEVEDLLAEMEVFDQRRPALADLQRVLVVGDRTSLGGGEHLGFTLRGLVEFATIPSGELLVVNPGRLVRGSFRWGAGHRSCSWLL